MSGPPPQTEAVERPTVDAAAQDKRRESMSAASDQALQLSVLRHLFPNYSYGVNDEKQWAARPIDSHRIGGRVTAWSARDLLWRLAEYDYTTREKM